LKSKLKKINFIGFSAHFEIIDEITPFIGDDTVLLDLSSEIKLGSTIHELESGDYALYKNGSNILILKGTTKAHRVNKKPITRLEWGAITSTLFISKVENKLYYHPAAYKITA